MSTTATTTRPEGGLQSPRTNSLTSGQMPGWTWMVVAAGAIVLGALITLLLADGFNVAGFLVITAVLFVIGMYVATRVLENRRRATDGLWRHLVWLAFLIALAPLISVLWSVIATGLPTLISNPHLIAYDMKGVTGVADANWVEAGMPAGDLPGGFGHALLGTVLITLAACVISIPIGVLTAIEPVVSVVSAPALRRRWYAAKGAGAYRVFGGEPKRLHVSQIEKLGHASLAMSSLTGWSERGLRDKFLNLTDKTWRLRGYGDFWSYCLVAEGAVDIATEPEVSLWDLAAPSLLVTEAGGTFTDLSGNPGPHGGSAIASNGRLHKAALEMLQD